MTPNKLSALERVAKKAGAVRGKDETPWCLTKRDDRGMQSVLTEPGGADFAEQVPDFIAPFIAAANPTVVLELIDMVRALRTALRKTQRK